MSGSRRLGYQRVSAGAELGIRVVHGTSVGRGQQAWHSGAKMPLTGNAALGSSVADGGGPVGVNDSKELGCTDGELDGRGPWELGCTDGGLRGMDDPRDLGCTDEEPAGAGPWAI
jgi:hypothetical protein